METRRLQRTGGTSLTLTLPKRWAERLKLGSKDVVTVEERKSGVLHIRALSESQKQLASALEVDAYSDNMLFREIVAHYISGMDEITIHAKSIGAQKRDLIRRITHTLVGFEIVEESGNAIVLKNILDASKFSVAKNIENMFSVTHAMMQDSLQSLVENDARLASDVIERDAEVDKWQLAITRQAHSLMCDRLSEEEAQLALFEVGYYEHIALQLERIADHAVKIARAAHAFGKKASKDARTLAHFKQSSKTILDLFSSAKKMVAENDKALAHVILDQGVRDKDKGYLMRFVREERNAVLVVVEDSIERWMGYIMNMAERTIDHVVTAQNNSR